MTSVVDSIISLLNLLTTQRLVIWFSMAKTSKTSKKIYIKLQPGLIDGRCPFQIGSENKRFDYLKCGVKLKNVQCAKELGVKIASNLKFSQQCIDAANKANRMLGFINRNSSSKNTDVIVPLCNSLVRPHFEYAIHFRSPTTHRP